MRSWRRGHTAADELEQCARLDAAGIRYSFFYLVGIAGAGRGQESALASARVFSKLNPRRVSILSMTVFPEARLARDIEQGRFAPASEVENLHEIRTLIAHLSCATYVSTAHVSDVVQVEGVLPRDREALVSYLDACIAHADEGKLARYRAGIRSL